VEAPLRGERVRAAQLLIYTRHLWVIGRSVDPRTPLQYQRLTTKRSLKIKIACLRRSPPVEGTGKSANQQISLQWVSKPLSPKLNVVTAEDTAAAVRRCAEETGTQLSRFITITSKGSNIGNSAHRRAVLY
jgi:hypothetical protein